MTDNYSSSDIAFIVNDAALVAAFKDTPIEQKMLEESIRNNPSSLGQAQLTLAPRRKSDLMYNNYGRTRTRNNHKTA